MSNDRKYQKKDHVITIEIPGRGVVESDHMTSDNASELFSWLSSYFTALRTTITQLVPIEYERRELWAQEPGGGPTTHIADAIREDEE